MLLDNSLIAAHQSNCHPETEASATLCQPFSFKICSLLHMPKGLVVVRLARFIASYIALRVISMLEQSRPFDLSAAELATIQSLRSPIGVCGRFGRLADLAVQATRQPQRGRNSDVYPISAHGTANWQLQEQNMGEVCQPQLGYPEFPTSAAFANHCKMLSIMISLPDVILDDQHWFIWGSQQLWPASASALKLRIFNFS